MNLTSDAAVDSFYRWLANSWEFLYKELLKEKYRPIKEINDRNPYPDAITLTITPALINMKKDEKFSKQVEMYISPSLQEANIPAVEHMYKQYLKFKKELPNLVVAKYYPFSKEMGRITELNGSDGKIPLDLFHVHFVYEPKSEEKNAKMLLHILIIADQSLEKYFKWVDTIKSRIPVAPELIAQLIMNFMGEYNYLHRTSSVRILCTHDENANIEHAKPITEIRARYEELEVMHYPNIQRCLYCQHTEYQVNLLRCGRCHAKYCSVYCQKAHFDLHKTNCKANSVKTNLK